MEVSSHSAHRHDDAIATVRRYLDAMEARDLATARAMLAPDFQMVFPGGAKFTALEDLIVWAKPRYKFVRKVYSRYDAAPATDGIAVTCFGTLEGAWHDSRLFSGIRFCDWFLVRDGRLVRQEVWNDMGETNGAADA